MPGQAAAAELVLCGPQLLSMAEKSKIRCDVTGYTFPAVSVQECPSPAVVKKYGVGGKANVCIYVCRKCKHAIPCEFFGGLRCGLKEQKA